MMRTWRWRVKHVAPRMARMRDPIGSPTHGRFSTPFQPRQHRHQRRPPHEPEAASQEQHRLAAEVVASQAEQVRFSSEPCGDEDGTTTPRSLAVVTVRGVRTVGTLSTTKLSDLKKFFTAHSHCAGAFTCPLRQPSYTCLECSHHRDHDECAHTRRAGSAHLLRCVHREAASEATPGESLLVQYSTPLARLSGACGVVWRSGEQVTVPAMGDGSGVVEGHVQPLPPLPSVSMEELPHHPRAMHRNLELENVLGYVYHRHGYTEPQLEFRASDCAGVIPEQPEEATGGQVERIPGRCEPCQAAAAALMRKGRTYATKLVSSIRGDHPVSAAQLRRKRHHTHVLENSRKYRAKLRQNHVGDMRSDLKTATASANALEFDVNRLKDLVKQVEGELGEAAVEMRLLTVQNVMANRSRNAVSTP